MVDQTRPEIAAIQASNKARIYQKRKEAEEQLKQLLNQFSSDDLIDLIMKIKEEE